MEQEIRIFISYSHKDKALAKKIAQAIEKNKMIPLWDENLIAGTGFPEQIKDYISTVPCIYAFAYRIFLRTRVGTSGNRLCNGIAYTCFPHYH